MSEYIDSITNPRLAELLLAGKVGVIPTDTVYGLVGRASDESAVTKLYGVKSRERQPGTTIAASPEQLQSLGFPAEDLEVAKRFWPNAVSVEMSAAGVAEYLKAGQSLMAARVPDNEALRELLLVAGPLMTTSANAPKQPTSTSVSMAQDYFGDDVDFYVEGGDLSGRPPSTIIGVKSDQSIVVYREGAVKINH